MRIITSILARYKDIKLKDASIGAKVLLPILTGFVLLILTFILLIVNLQQEKNMALKNIAASQHIITMSDDLDALQNQVQQAVNDYRQNKDKNSLSTIYSKDSAMYSVMDEMSKYLTDPQGRGLLKIYRSDKEEAVKYRTALFAEIDKNSPPQIINAAYGQWSSKVLAVDAGLPRIASFGSSLLDRDVAAFREIIRVVVLTYLGICFITMLLIVLLYLYLKNLILRPINLLTLGAKRVSEGDLDWAVKIGSLDEIGKLGLAFNEMTKRLSNSYTDLQVLAFSDPLTGLPNRQALEQKLQSAISEAGRQKSLLGVIMLDLDRFKKINDTFGHDAGDKVLKEAAGRILSALRPQDTVVRLGGDEFVIILPGLTTAHGILVAAERILKSIGEVMVVDGRQLYVNASAGAAIYPNDGEDLSGLIKASDIALYGAKAGGRNRYNLYNKVTDLKPQAQMELENDLRTALAKDQFKVFYQPLQSLQNGKTVAVEALLRWQHPGLGLLLPHEFIPLAEEVGAINQIGRWALKTACMAGKKWEEQKLPFIQIAVNLSAKQFSEEDLVTNITNILQDTGLSPENLGLEVTESLAMADLEKTKEKLQRLREMGITLSIDDFGSGYSSLSYLRDFPANKIKIDRSFIRHMVTEQDDTAIVKAVITMGHNLNLIVAAEGVETETQMALLKSLGCDEVQGFLIGRPMSEPDFTEWLLNNGEKNVEKKVLEETEQAPGVVKDA